MTDKISDLDNKCAALTKLNKLNLYKNLLK